MPVRMWARDMSRIGLPTWAGWQTHTRPHRPGGWRTRVRVLAGPFRGSSPGLADGCSPCARLCPGLLSWEDQS